MKFLSDRALDRLRAGAESPDLAGTRYRLSHLVARGGMGIVYAAEDERLHRRVALKVLDVPGENSDLANRLIREAHVLARLEHPGIVPVHDVGTLPDGRIFYTMKFVEGQRLDEYARTLESIPDRLRLFLRICDAVAFAHSRGVLHRDLKPSNIMVGSFGEVLVMDWGLAKILDAQATQSLGRGDPDGTILASSPAQASEETASTEIFIRTGHGTVMGTPGFMSPEQARGEIEHLDVRSDIYSLGAVLRTLIFTENKKTSSLNQQRRDRALEAICSKATALDPAARYPLVQDLALDVSRYLDGLAVTAHPESVFEKLGRFYRRHRFFILLITAYLAVRVLLLLLTRK